MTPQEMDAVLEAIDRRLSGMDARLERVETRVIVMDDRLGRVETSVQNLDRRTASIEQILPTLATKDDLAAARGETRVLIEGVQDNVRLLAERMTTLFDRLDRLS